jgi:phosphate-selective porin OprO/OprP
MRIFHAIRGALLLLFAAGTVGAQTRTVTGTVRANTTGQPVSGVNVRLRGALQLVTTDGAGQYRIDVPAGSAEILDFTHPDYDRLEREISGQTIVDVVLITRVRVNQYQVRVDRRPLVGEDRDGILVFESPDLNYRFWFDMRVNVDGTLIYGDKFNATGSGTEIRRARMAMKSQFRRNWYAEVDMDFGDSHANLEDAYLMWTPNQSLDMAVRQTLDIRWGNFKETFSTEQTTSSRYNTFLERPMVTNALAPSRRVGTEVRWRPAQLLVAGGVHFQDVGDDEVTLATKDNNKDRGVDEGFALTGKVVYLPLVNRRHQGIHIALAASRRTPTSDDVAGAMRFNTRVVTKTNKKKYIDTDYITNVSHEFVKGAELGVFHNGLKVYAEGTAADVSRKNGSPTASFSGAFVTASAMLFGGSYNYNTADAEFTESNLGRSWGDAELALRYEYLDMNSKDAGIMGGAGEAFTVGFNMFPSRNVRFMLNWSLVNNDRYANGRGKLYVGRDAKGVLTKDPLLVAAPTGKGGEDFKVLGLRVQVSF